MSAVQGGLYKNPELIPAKNIARLEEIDKECDGGVGRSWRKAVFFDEGT